MSSAPGPLALVGSGEYQPSMQAIEAGLIAGRAPRYVQIATAAVPDGEAVVAKWERMGREQASRIGVEAVTVTVRTRTDAENPELVDLLTGAGLIYFSGGHPGFLADTLRDTPFIQRVRELWQGGAALAGCSAGAMAMAARVPSLRHPRKGGTDGFGFLPHLRVLPHFDTFPRWIPDVVTRVMSDLPDGVSVIGVDEETAIIGGPTQWRVEGHGSAWTLRHGGATQHPAHTSFHTPA